MKETIDPAEPESPPGGATWREAPGLVARGVCMGTADVVPGVSGGTMALILGIYARWILAIKSFDHEALGLVWRGRLREARQRVGWRLLGPIVFGQALGVVSFTKLIPLPELARTHHELVYALFFGLIVGSVWILGRQVFDAGLTRGRLTAALAGLAVGLIIVNLVRVASPPSWTESPWFIFLCGCVAICAMVLPGISGSFLLLILHKYEFVLGALGEFISPAEGGGRLAPLLEVVLPFGLGCVVGIVAFSRFLGWLLARAEKATLSFMVGLMVGSLWVIWPYQDATTVVVREKVRVVGSTPVLPASFDGQVALVALIAAAGVAAVVAMETAARKRSGGASRSVA